jgi:hypothetical protein
MILREKPLFVIRKPHEEIAEEDIRRAVWQLVPIEKEQLLLLRDTASKCFTNMIEAFAENSFATSNSIIPQANEPPIHGLFLLLSRFNHSCIPNSKFPSTDGEVIACFATKDIAAGEEITFCYNLDF